MSTSTLEVVPDTFATLTFCRTLLGDDLTEFRLIHPKLSEGMEKTIHFWGSPQDEKLLAFLAQYNARGYGVYAVINRCTPEVEKRCKAGMGARDEDITEIRAVFADLDHEDMSGSNLAKIRAVSLPASALVCTGLEYKFQPYWKVSGLSPNEFERVQKAVAAYFGSDTTVSNPARVMRLPGFINTKPKYDSPLVKLLEAPGQVYTFAEFCRAFGIPLEAPKPPERPLPEERVMIPHDADRLRRYALAALQKEADTLAAMPADSGRNSRLNRAAFVLGGFIPHGLLEHREIQDALMDAARVCGLVDEDSERATRTTLESGLSKAPPRDLAKLERRTQTTRKTKIATAKAETEIIVNRQVKEVVEELVTELKALELKGNPRIYSRGDGLLVEMQDGFELQEVTKTDSLKALLHDHLRPVVEKGPETARYTAPSTFSNNHTSLLLRKTADFPPITAVSDIPLMLPDGSILSEPGYHRDYGYYLNTAGIEVELMSLGQARGLFLETFNEFSYQAPRAGFTATLAFILQPFLMPMIDDLTPLYAILGARRSGSGTGKGYLLDCVYRIHRGSPYMHDGSMPATNEECGKVLFAALSEGASHVIFDDIEHLKHRELMAAITTRTYKGRILGVSQRHEVSTQVTWAVSGNAPEIHRDFYRRLIPIHLGTGKARAWERQYTRPDLNRYILENRNLFISAVLSILEHWRSLGMPLSDKAIKGFDRWSAVMGGVLESAGFPHLLEARDGLDQLIEVDNSDLDLLMDAWRGSIWYRGKKLKGKDLLTLAKNHELLTHLYENKSEAAGAAELGKYLKPFINDIFGEHYLRREFDSDAKTWRYFLEAIPEAPLLLLDVFNFPPCETTPEHPRSTPVTTPTDGFTGVLRGSIGSVSIGDEVSKENSEPLLAWDDL